MGRLQAVCVAATTLTTGLALAALVNGCRAQPREAETPPRRTGTAIAGPGSRLDRAKLQACYDGAKVNNPSLSVHTIALYFARDGKLVFVDVDLPASPQLARCLREAMLSWPAFGPPVAGPPGSFSSGAIRIDFGAPSTTPTNSPTAEEFEARFHRITLEALRAGALRPDDPPVRELRSPAPPWPTPQMRAELEACHRASSQPTLPLRRNVFFLTRGGRVLLADVAIPEDSGLEQCVLQRIVGWESPVSSESETVLSSFLIELGGPEELTDEVMRARLNGELTRRDALVRRALQLGLLESSDPLLERLKARPAGASAAP
jgi:hypothetical protein